MITFIRKIIITLSALLISISFCVGQAKIKIVSSENHESEKGKNPLYVFKVEDKSLEFDSKDDHSFDLKNLDSNLIETISVWKGEEATKNYGDKGENGVVVITLKDFDSLPGDLKKMFDAKKE